ncbi:hypothetical protein [Patulibacter sp. SYSU D01012]|uniref:hypothetical protein n=1 Tax=Patulibacter sp. SYSU D01012 TaxID=2817381 RepID=UPI001B3103DF|nr:hypothetical protein [Patulibacter sp. SYSU D01012]
MDWVEVVGYQHEVVHTGVLRWALRAEPSSDRPHRLLQAMGVDAVQVDGDTVATEGRLTAARRGPGKADLVADITLAGGARSRLAVETKVDSRATFDQLQATMDDIAHRGVLLAVGLTGLQFDPRSLPSERWRFVDVRRWQQALAEAGVLPELGPYADAIAAEVRRQEDARATARRCEDVLPDLDGDGGSRRIDGGTFVAWAWLAETRDQLQGQPAPWHGQTERSGPVIWSAPPKWKQADTGVDVYLSLTVEQRTPKLAVRVGGGRHLSDEMRVLAGGLADGLDDLGFARPKRALSRGRGTYAAATLNLLGRPPAAAAIEIIRTIERLDRIAGSGS